MKEDLDWCRGQINLIDAQLIKLLEKRYEIVQKVAEYKKENHLPVRDAKREAELIVTMSANTALESEFIKNFYSLIFNYSYLIEQ